MEVVINLLTKTKTMKILKSWIKWKLEILESWIKWKSFIYPYNQWWRIRYKLLKQRQ